MTSEEAQYANIERLHVVQRWRLCRQIRGKNIPVGDDPMQWGKHGTGWCEHSGRHQPPAEMGGAGQRMCMNRLGRRMNGWSRRWGSASLAAGGCNEVVRTKGGKAASIHTLEQKRPASARDLGSRHVR